MRKLLVILSVAVSCLYSADIQAQEETEAVRKIDSLFNIIYKTTPGEYREDVFKKSSIKEEEIQKAHDLLFYSYSKVPQEFRQIRLNEIKLWKDKVINNEIPKNSVNPSVRLSMLKEKLAEVYGWEYVRFMETPYFLKVKVLDIRGGMYENPEDEKVSLPEVVLKVEIMDVVKGGEAFDIGKELSIGYLPHWFRYHVAPNINKDEIYAIPVRYWTSEYAESEYALDLYGLHTLYKVENNIVISPLEPEKSPNINWADFKKEFSQKFLQAHGGNQ